MIDWLIDWLTDWLIDLLIDQSINRSIDLLIDWLIDWLNYILDQPISWRMAVKGQYDCNFVIVVMHTCPWAMPLKSSDHEERNPWVSLMRLWCCATGGPSGYQSLAIILHLSHYKLTSQPLFSPLAKMETRWYQNISF